MTVPRSQAVPLTADRAWCPEVSLGSATGPCSCSAEEPGTQSWGSLGSAPALGLLKFSASSGVSLVTGAFPAVSAGPAAARTAWAQTPGFSLLAWQRSAVPQYFKTCPSGVCSLLLSFLLSWDLRGLIFTFTLPCAFEVPISSPHRGLL